MPAKEIKELRQAGSLEEAYNMAIAELEAEPDNIWAKRNISWVYYDYLKLYSSVEYFDQFISKLNAIKELNLPAEETMLFEKSVWQIAKLAFSIVRDQQNFIERINILYTTIRDIHFPKPSAGYSFLYKAFHKAFKETVTFHEFADWWGLEHFMPKDFQKEKLPNGREIMSIAEQAYITYTKHLLPRTTFAGEVIFDRVKSEAFLPVINWLAENYPQFQYPPYFHAKLLFALGDNDNMLITILPFVKRKRNDFWAWEVLGDAFANDADKAFACYCKALSCNSPEEMLVSLRQKVARLFLSRNMFSEAKTEIELLIKIRTEQGWKIPGEVTNWQLQPWYTSATVKASNDSSYNQFLWKAEEILFSDIPETTIIVEFVNTERKILNFIASESEFGFFKYERFLKDVKMGDILKVRIQDGKNGGNFRIYTAINTVDDNFKKQFFQDVEGYIQIKQGQAFGFLNDVFIHPKLVSKYKLADGIFYKGIAIKSFNQEKSKWGWKLL